MNGSASRFFLVTEKTLEQWVQFKLEIVRKNGSRPLELQELA